MAITAFTVLSFISRAQPVSNPSVKKENRPYKFLCSGKEITIKSNRIIQHIMVWTTSGHRVVEQRDINAAFFTFTIPINEKIYFMMVGLEGGKVYTEKIGIQ
jgi:hypothetical protein